MAPTWLKLHRRKHDKGRVNLLNTPLHRVITHENDTGGKVNMADSDPRLAPHNVNTVGGGSGNVKGQYDVSQQARKKSAANSNNTQSPLAAW